MAGCQQGAGCAGQGAGTHVGWQVLYFALQPRQRLLFAVSCSWCRRLIKATEGYRLQVFDKSTAISCQQCQCGLSRCPWYGLIPPERQPAARPLAAACPLAVGCWKLLGTWEAVTAVIAGITKCSCNQEPYTCIRRSWYVLQKAGHSCLERPTQTLLGIPASSSRHNLESATSLLHCGLASPAQHCKDSSQALPAS